MLPAGTPLAVTGCFDTPGFLVFLFGYPLAFRAVFLRLPLELLASRGPRFRRARGSRRLGLPLRLAIAIEGAFRFPLGTIGLSSRRSERAFRLPLKLAGRGGPAA